MRVYSFDVDETLEISNGPVTLAMMEELRLQGHIVGICGNMSKWCEVPDWHRRISFLGQGYVPKRMFLYNLRENIKVAEEYIHVGNVFGRVNSLGFTCGSNDKDEAEHVGWRFIVEDDFANGVR